MRSRHHWYSYKVDSSFLQSARRGWVFAIHIHFNDLTIQNVLWHGRHCRLSVFPFSRCGEKFCECVIFQRPIFPTLFRRWQWGRRDHRGNIEKYCYREEYCLLNESFDFSLRSCPFLPSRWFWFFWKANQAGSLCLTGELSVCTHFQLAGILLSEGIKGFLKWCFFISAAV